MGLNADGRRVVRVLDAFIVYGFAVAGVVALTFETSPWLAVPFLFALIAAAWRSLQRGQDVP